MFTCRLHPAYEKKQKKTNKDYYSIPHLAFLINSYAKYNSIKR